MTSINICIIEDEPEILETLKTFFELKGQKVWCFKSAEDFEASDMSNFDGLYLIDWNLPGKDGIQLIKELRDEDEISPIFIVSGYGQKEQVIEGLKAGADDYITKPFNFDELYTRAVNAFKKYNMYSQGSDPRSVKLLPEANSFIMAEKVISLTQREFVIFAYLYENCNKPVSREELLGQFSKDDQMTVRNIDVHVFSLRKKIKDADLNVQTIRGIGYQLTILG